MKEMLLWTGMLLSAIVLAGMSAGTLPAEGVEGGKSGLSAVAVLHPTQDSDVSGVVRFAKVAGGVKVTATVKGLTPGKHGFHIHEYGDCSAPEATSAGGHYNPDGHPHAGPDQTPRHMGDLGNLEADETGTAAYERVNDYLTLEGEKSIIGHAMIVHAGEDDFTTQPTGAAGGRMACGVIGIAK